MMLVSPVGLESLAQADVQYASLDISTWGQDDTGIHYEYDDNGSLTKKITTIAGDPPPYNNATEIITYEYNLQNRLAKVTTDDGVTVSVTECKYNPAGIRVEKDVDGTVTDYLVDPYNHTGYAQVLVENDGTNKVAYTIGDDVLAHATNSSDPQYLLYDGHGSTRQLTASDGTTINNSYSYDAYGVMLGGNPTSANPAATSLLYAGEQFDTDSQNYYLRARWYNPLNGRFNRMDPFAGNNRDPQSLHKYLYAHNNPVNGIDPSGMTLSQVVVGIGIGMSIAGISLAIVGSVMDNETIRDIGFWSSGIGAMLIGGGVALASGGIIAVLGAEAIATTLVTSPISLTVIIIGTLCADRVVKLKTRHDLMRFIESRNAPYFNGDRLIPPKGNIILRDSGYVRIGEDFGEVQYKQPPYLPGDKIISYDSTMPDLKANNKVRLVLNEVEKNGSLDKEYETIYDLKSRRKNVIDDNLPEGWVIARRN